MKSLRIYWLLVKLSIWNVARVWGFWKEHRQIPVCICLSAKYHFQRKWWNKEILKLNKRRGKLDVKFLRKRFGINI